MTVGELMGVIVDATLPGEPKLKLICSGCTAYGEELSTTPDVVEVVETAEEHIRVAHRQEGLRVTESLRKGISELGLLVDQTDPRFLRVKVGCTCGKWTVGFQALPTTEVTVNRLLASSAEHLARQHGYRPQFSEGVASSERLPRADVIGPVGG